MLDPGALPQLVATTAATTVARIWSVGAPAADTSSVATTFCGAWAVVTRRQKTPSTPLGVSVTFFELSIAPAALTWANASALPGAPARPGGPALGLPPDLCDPAVRAYRADRACAAAAPRSPAVRKRRPSSAMPDRRSRAAIRSRPPRSPPPPTATISAKNPTTVPAAGQPPLRVMLPPQNWMDRRH
jgi:hypothetical protein